MVVLEVMEVMVQVVLGLFQAAAVAAVVMVTEELEPEDRLIYM